MDPLANTPEIFRRVLKRQMESLRSANQQILDDQIRQAIALIVPCTGRLILTGMGKMGAVGRKAAATFSSTGTPSIFVHPSEALHGDLGMIARQDVIVALSYSGETDEVLQVVEVVQPWQVPVIALTRSDDNTLARLSDLSLSIQVAQEATDLVAVPSCSTTVAMAVCDALAIAVMESRGFTAEDFSIFHPGGTLGRRLRIRVDDLMRTGSQIPCIAATQTLRQAIVQVSAGGVGATLITDPENQLIGILTDGDIRRILEVHENPLDEAVQTWMSQSPKCCPAGILAAQALRLMEQFRITVLPVTGDSGQLLGIVHLHDLVSARIS